MTAEIVSVGSELLLGQIVDTNATYLAGLLAETGIAHFHRQTVGDNLERLSQGLRLALSRADIVITIGGLGPTQDDLTREGIAAALADELVLDSEIERRLRELFNQRGLKWVDSQLRQAMRPRCSRPIDNSNGTAPGLHCVKGGKTVIALPGPPGELKPMANGTVRQLLAGLGGGHTIRSRTLRVVGLGESLIEERIAHLLDSQNPTVAPYAKLFEVHLRLTAKAKSDREADDLIDPVDAEIAGLLGEAMYGRGESTLESVTIDLLRASGKSLGTAESCTGGGLAARLTAVPGLSDTFVGGVVTYTNGVKQNLLGVSAESLQECGAISARVAEEMAQGVCDRLGTDYGLSITGVAGPNPAEDKAVGLVYVGLAGPSGVETSEHRFGGQREDIRNRATQAALMLLRKRILDDTKSS